jgi:TatD DNase family protein
VTKLIDTHVHLYYSHFDHDREQVMERTWKVCEAVICIGADIKSSKETLRLAEQDARIYASVGIHPHESHEDPGVLEELARHPKVVAIGECGLDFKLDPVHPNSGLDKKAQLRSAKMQIELANKLGLPIILHCRDGWSELIDLLREAKPKAGLIHSWTGRVVEAQALFELGLYISFSGMLTYPANEHIRQVARLAPLDRLLLETDAPYLPPQALRGQRNEPANVKMTAEKLAEVRQAQYEEIVAATTENAKKLFSII